MTEGTKYLLCARWKSRPRSVKTLERVCGKCHAPVSIEATNAEFVDSGEFTPVCVPCAKPMLEEQGGEFAGGLVGGRRYADARTAMAAARALIDRN